MADPSETLANFMAITECADDAKALQTLEACGWNLGEAVSLHIAASEAGGAGAGPSSAQQAAPAVDEEGVRAPMQSKVERLVEPGPFALRGGPLGLFGARAGPAAAGRTTPAVNAFRSFEAEGKEGAERPSAALSSLFKPPVDLLFQGDFEEMKAHAANEGKWLLVNVQSQSEFASFRLNRDTWSNEILQGMMKGMMVFFQVYDDTPEGQQLVGNYRIQGVPATCVIDPITGLRLFEKHGYVEAEQLIEDLVPFMDTGPKDPGAGRLAQMMAVKHRRPGKQNQGSTPPKRDLSEDEQLAMAIAASMEQGTSGQGQGKESGTTEEDDGSDDELDEAAVYAAIAREDQQRALQEKQKAEEAARPPPEKVMEDAQGRLPPEPTEGAMCRVAIRLPTGDRVQRRFQRSDKVQSIMDLVLSKTHEAAAGRKFEVVASYPGAQPLKDAGATLESAGVSNDMLVVKWID